jgi:hypothetical protein
MNSSLGTRILTVATAVTVISVTAGIVIVGSPARGRLEQLDSGRISDLQSITAAIDFAFQADSVLPASLEALSRDPRTQVNTMDPGTLAPYEYPIIDGDSYQLCATFDRDASDPALRAPTAFWAHPAGRHCFDLDARAVR